MLAIQNISSDLSQPFIRSLTSLALPESFHTLTFLPSNLALCGPHPITLVLSAFNPQMFVNQIVLFFTNLGDSLKT